MKEILTKISDDKLKVERVFAEEEELTRGEIERRMERLRLRLARLKSYLTELDK